MKCPMKGKNMHDLNMKILTIQNWLKPDELMDNFIYRTVIDNNTRKVTDDMWASYILEPQLSDQVPKEVRELYEVSRGGLLYGYFFYPLYSLAGEQLFRVAESASKYKCKELNAPKSVSTFEKYIDFLIDKNAINKNEKNRWDAIRLLRNKTSHPVNIQILTPSMVIENLRHITDMVNILFRTRAGHFT